MSHQDWNVITFGKVKNKLSKTKKKSKRVKTVNKSKKYDSKESISKPVIKVYKLIQKGRMLNKMSQKDLAQILNIPHTFIQSYEMNKSIPGNRLLQRMEKILKIKLTGENIGDIIEDDVKKN